MFDDLTVTALSGLMAALAIVVVLKGFDFIAKQGKAGNFIAKAVVIVLILYPVFYFFRQAGWI